MGVINGKAGKAAALPKSSDMLTLSQPGGADYAHPLALPCLRKFCNYAPGYYCYLVLSRILCSKSMVLQTKCFPFFLSFFLAGFLVANTSSIVTYFLA